MKRAIVYGASGLVGSYILETLLQNEDYAQVTIVVRKGLHIRHPKLKELIGDFHSLRDLVKDIGAEEIYIALGTTQKKTPDRKGYYQIDHDYPVLAAQLAKANGATSVFLVSAVGANSHSSIFYTKTKGETERDIIGLDLDHTYIFRPSMILGSRKESRRLEKIFQSVCKAINPLLIGKLSNYRGLDARYIAQAMVNAAGQLHDKVKVFHWKEMSALL